MFLPRHAHTTAHRPATVLNAASSGALVHRPQHNQPVSDDPCQVVDLDVRIPIAAHQAVRYYIPRGKETAAHQALQQAGITLVRLVPLAETVNQQHQQWAGPQQPYVADSTHVQQLPILSHAQQQSLEQEPVLGVQHGDTQQAVGQLSTGHHIKRQRRRQPALAPVVPQAVAASLNTPRPSQYQQPDQLQQQQREQWHHQGSAAGPAPATAGAAQAPAALTEPPVQEGPVAAFVPTASTAPPAVAGAPGPEESLASSAPAAADVSVLGAPDAAAESRPAWALAVDRGLAALLPSTRSARNNRWSPRPQAAPTTWLPAAGRAVASRTTTNAGSRAVGRGVPQGLLATASIDEYLQGGDLSAEGEQQLCLAYQRYIQLQQLAAQAQVLEGSRQLVYPGQWGKQPAGASLGAAGSSTLLMQDPATVQREGLLAQELLLRLYEPLVVSRAKRAARGGSDLRDLLVASRQGVLRAAANFDPQRAAVGNNGRLAALAELHIKMALRDVLQEYQTGAVNVPGHVRELAARLKRIELDLQRQQPGRQPTLSEVAAAAGVSLVRAQRARAAIGSAMQATSLQPVEQEKEDWGKAGAGIDLQQVDVSMEEDSAALSGVVGAGGLAAARSGLHEELDAAAERDVVDKLLQDLVARLNPQDRDLLLQTKVEGGNISQAARERGVSREWGRRLVDRVVQKLREDVERHMARDVELAALLGR